MSISPRKEEVAAVVALLESDQFDTSQQMGAAIIRQVADDLSRRTTRGVAVGMPGCKPALAIGPFYDVRSAKNCAQEAQEAGLEARMARLSGTGSIRAAQTLRRVCLCGHRTEMHVFAVCGVTNCKCEGVTYGD